MHSFLAIMGTKLFSLIHTSIAQVVDSEHVLMANLHLGNARLSNPASTKTREGEVSWPNARESFF